MSINLLVPDEDAAVIWRGPLIPGAVGQFWTDVEWGQLDYLLVDLPPGTFDAGLTVMQNLPVDRVIVVTIPQELAAIEVCKAVHMAGQLNVRVLGVVENMSCFVCPDTDKRHESFGPSHADQVAATAGAPVLARLPMDPQIAALCDAGDVASAARPEIEALATALSQLALVSPAAAMVSNR
jgi:Mrp family chromosome partitioning ATPase